MDTRENPSSAHNQRSSNKWKQKRENGETIGESKCKSPKNEQDYKNNSNLDKNSSKSCRQLKAVKM